MRPSYRRDRQRGASAPRCTRWLSQIRLEAAKFKEGARHRPHNFTSLDLELPRMTRRRDSTLQAGTHALFILEGLTAEDLAEDIESTSDPDKQVSMMRLSVLQEILVRMIDD